MPPITSSHPLGSGEDNSPPTSTSRKRRGLACERCRSRKQKCLPGQGSRCRNCQRADTPCEFIEKSANEIYLQRYTTELENRVKQLEEYITSSRISIAASTSASASGSSQSPQNQNQSQNSQSTYPGGNIDASGSGRRGSDDDNLATGVGFLSLNGSSDPLYLGGSSGVGWAKVLMHSLKHKTTTSTSPRINRLSPSSHTIHLNPYPPDISDQVPLPAPPAENLGIHYITTVYYRVQSRYGFLDWVNIQGWQADYKKLCGLQPLNTHREGEISGSVEDHFGAFFLWMLYGFGAKLCENEGPVPHEVYFNTALRHFAPLSTIQSLTTVQALLLLIVYTFRHTSSELSLWHTGGLAIRSAIELGLHRKIRSKEIRERDPRAYCMRQRVWWGAYILDRMIAIQFGRPFAIQDRDIDIELPINLDANIADQEALCELLNAQALMPETNRPGDEYRNGYGCFTSMTSFIHTIRLNQLKSKIHELVYTVDKPLRQIEDSDAIQGILNELNMWRANYPLNPTDNRIPNCSHEFFEVEYHNCVQILLRPLAARDDAPDYWLRNCAGSAAAVLDIECQLLRRDSKNLATWVLCKIFMSGLTLLHVIWNHPQVLPSSTVSRALRSCSTCLFIYAQQFPIAGSYLDCFEDLVKAFDERREAHNNDTNNISGGNEHNISAMMGLSRSNDNTLVGAGTSFGANTNGDNATVPGVGVVSQADIWTDRLDNMGGMLPGLREDLASLINSFGPPNTDQPMMNTIPEPISLPFNNSNSFNGGMTNPTAQDPMIEMMWNLPFDSWTGDQTIDISSLFDNNDLQGFDLLNNHINTSNMNNLM
ncbi:hypothetical protein I302_109160 [Kwoniella bestiolae CBS 10118]|uniref:Zn(2)-C6 fungal-type domain-containing protein n=1 Tax=Kwoniella bestiolae CBS 10118 TaxID=1296100 RepID=A0A1B9FV62_9TREE|nr:hypothetical protein I302_08306 [Kwoniella bestiolae CBS 10118]OCF22655.1 hypothetical protein I302_08306 [Kwoniella bestiolae CBS 10118]